MRDSEWINVIVFSFFTILAWTRPLAHRNRATVTAMSVMGAGSMFAAEYGQRFYPIPFDMARDWLTAVLLLVTYWVAGQFFVHANEPLQTRLLQLDHTLRERMQRWLDRGSNHRWLTSYFELAYVFCYVLVPLGVAVLYLAHMRSYVDRYWTVVLPPTYICYGALPFVQTLPPRALEALPAAGGSTKILRHLNLWILRHGSIHVNTFPSGHVAASLSAALALLPVLPTAGVVFILIAISIAIGAVIGRYHFAADVVLAAALSLIVFLLDRSLRGGLTP